MASSLFRRSLGFFHSTRLFGTRITMSSLRSFRSIMSSPQLSLLARTALSSSLGSPRFQARACGAQTLRLYSNVAVSREGETGVDVEGDVAVGGGAEELPVGLRRELMPRHVAVIMDGNGRWAKSRGLPASFGHQAGVKALRELVAVCGKWGIRVLTVFAFSTDNWNRPKIEVNFLLKLFERSLRSELEGFARQNIRISVIGDTSKLPTSLLKTIEEIEESTKNNSNLHLIIAIGYSGKYDVLQACQSIAQKVKNEEIQVSDINESLVDQELETNCTKFPCPDLLIRTSGELRVSNFLLWQLAYTELFFAQSFWPDFGKDEFVEALKSFQHRQRRFGARNQ